MSDLQEKAPGISQKRMEELLFFQKKNGLEFDNIGLLDTAFTHSSYANERRVPVADNERLEFLGDSVLSAAVSTYLYDHLDGNEGECTRVRSFVVSEDSLSKAAKSLEIDRYLLIGKGEELTGGRRKKTILADCMEAVFAAVYLDRGFDAACAFILKLLVPEIDNVMSNRHRKDYKTMLQEYVQKTYKNVPVYTLVKTEGPEHDQLFWYCVEFDGHRYGPESGHNKKDAEQNAAHLAWKALHFEK